MPGARRAVSAQGSADVDPINRLIDRYGAAEAAMDMPAQAALMAPDRVWVNPRRGRRADNLVNMRIQEAQAEAKKKEVPGIQLFVEDRERLIKFYGGGAVAVASFFRSTTVVFPPNTPADVRQEYGSDYAPEAITLVLEKRDGEWKIVHTHV